MMKKMIEPEYYRLPKHEQPEQKVKADPETLAYLESLPWRPFDVEW